MKEGSALSMTAEPRTPLTEPAAVPPESTPQRPAYRLRYRRIGPAIWLAHLDMMRTFERAVRRAGWPIAWSGGYNPRPQMTFALPISVGLATEDDYFDVVMETACEPLWLMRRLNDSLPQGLSVTACGRLPADKVERSLMSRVIAAEYRLTHPELPAAWQAVSRLSADQSLVVDKHSKGKIRQLDIRPLLLDVAIGQPDSLLIRVEAGSRSNLRPDLLLQALVRYGGLQEQSAADSEMTRVRLWLRPADPSEPPISPLDDLPELVEW
ncbi:MAG: DUF2344 domain-containing protein [Opitutae bacterium]|nr:DUF2344 domain-containing protein [Opitutae bacterium]